MKVWILSLFILLTFIFSSFSQENPEGDKVFNDHEIIFFSNNGCGKCEVSQTFFEDNHMPFKKLTVRENRPLMYEYIHTKTGGKNVGIGYPVIVYQDSIYFSIKNIRHILEEVKAMMITDGVIEDEEVQADE